MMGDQMMGGMGGADSDKMAKEFKDKFGDIELNKDGSFKDESKLPKDIQMSD